MKIKYELMANTYDENGYRKSGSPICICKFELDEPAPPCIGAEVSFLLYGFLSSKFPHHGADEVSFLVKEVKMSYAPVFVSDDAVKNCVANKYTCAGPMRSGATVVLELA